MPKKLIPIAMVVPNKECVYAPSNIDPSINISDSEFKTLDVSSARVSLAADGVSNSTKMTVYRSNDQSRHYIKG